MRKITLLSATIENFKSFKGETRVDFTREEGFKLVGGVNKAQPRLGPNGVGKTTLWEAIFWCLYGSGILGQRTSDLTTWGEKQPKVVVTTDIDGELINIARQGSPNKMFLNGAPVEQERLDQVLGLSKVRFQHSVMFGQKVDLFPELAMTERSNLLNEVCDYGVWQRASNFVSDSLRDLDNNKAEAERAIAHAEGQLAMLAQQDTQRIQEQADRWDEDRRHQERETRKLITQTKEQITDLGDQIAKLQDRLSVLGTTEAIDSRIVTGRRLMQDHVSELRSIQDTINRNNKSIKFFEEHMNCPTCNQTISKSLRADQVSQLEQENDTVSKKADKLRSRLLSYEKAMHDLHLSREVITNDRLTLREHLVKAKALQEEKQGEVSRLIRRMEDISVDAANPFLHQLQLLEKQERKADRTLSGAIMQKRRVEQEIVALDYWKTGFKGVRLFLVEQTLRYLTLETEAAAQALGLKGWTISYVTEVENKSGTMRQGIQIVVESPTAKGVWESWSGGESQRLRLAIALGLASLIQQMAGVLYTWEVYDEPSVWLSAEGIEDMLECLRSRSTVEHKSIWLIDHRALDASSFDEIWRVTKRRSGSVVERVR